MSKGYLALCEHCGWTRNVEDEKDTRVQVEILKHRIGCQNVVLSEQRKLIRRLKDEQRVDLDSVVGIDLN